jgi:membrane-associated phospholipid phosphatase
VSRLPVPRRSRAAGSLGGALAAVALLVSPLAYAQEAADSDAGAAAPAAPSAPKASAPPSAPETSAPPAAVSRRYPTREELRRYNFGPTEECPYCGETPSHPQGVRGLHWHDHWRRVGVMEYVATPVLFGVALGVTFLLPKQKHPTWTGAILFDRPVQKAIEQQSDSARRTTATVSDVLFGVSVAYPILVDNLFVSWALRSSPDVAWQLTVIDAQAYALTLVLNSATKRLAGRERPSGENCRHNSPPGAACNSSGTFESFYSGHAAMTATSAGLMCAHHTQLMLYRSGGDTAACITAIGFAAATDVLRITSANHWASDVLAGSLMGYFSGYLLPTLLYYKEFSFTPHEQEPPSNRPTVAVLPLAGADSLGVTALGTF